MKISNKNTELNQKCGIILSLSGNEVSEENINKIKAAEEKVEIRYNFVKDYPDWIMKKTEKTTKLFYSKDMSTFDVHIAWVAKDITVK